eukprot:10044891-Alexandrium_andersonii.AAC.1
MSCFALPKESPPPSLSSAFAPTRAKVEKRANSDSITSATVQEQRYFGRMPAFILGDLSAELH